MYMYVVCVCVCVYVCVRQHVWYIHTMQESELECIQIQLKVDQLREEKERLVNSLTEAE